MAVRLMALALLGFILSMLSVVWPMLVQAGPLAKAGGFIFYGAATFVAIYGLVTGKTP